MLSNVLFIKNTSIPSFSLRYLLSASKGDKRTATISLPQLCIQSKSGSKEDLQSPTDKAMVENTAKKKKKKEVKCDK